MTKTTIDKGAKKSANVNADLFEKIVVSFPQPVGIWDVQKRFVYANRALERLMGLSREAYLDKSLRELHCPPYYEAQLNADLQTVLDEGLASSGEVDLSEVGFPVQFRYTMYRLEGSSSSGPFVMGMVAGVEPSAQGLPTQIKEAAAPSYRKDQQYRRIFESIDEGFCVVQVIFDEQGKAFDYRFVETNPAFNRHSGFENPEGKTVRELMPQLNESWFRLIGRVASTGRKERLVEHLSSRDRWFEVDAFRLGKPAERTVALLLRDVTERKRAEDELLRVLGLLEGITRGSEDLIAALDNDFRFLYFNEAYRQEFRKLWRYDVEEGCSIVEAMSPWPEEQRKTKNLWGRALSGESFRVQMDFGPNETERRIYDLRFNPIRNPQGRAVGAAHIFRDITDQVRVQNELRASEERLRESDRRKDEYLAMLGHELRNPLAAVRNATELIKHTKSADPRLKRASGVLERQTTHMARLIDGLLEVSRIARGKIGLDKEVIDLRHVLGGVLQDRSAHSANRQINLQRDFPPHPVWVSGDPVRLAQVFDNLMGNAIKFCKAGDSILVAIEHRTDQVLVAVNDTGIGITSEMLPRIFEAFFQGQQDIARATGGLGLGLALVKGLVELHAGTIEVHSEGPGKGTQFHVRLPVAQAPQQEISTQSYSPVTPCHILIVEDNVDAGQTLCELLNLQGHRAHLVEGAAEALSYLRQRGADVVLCDLGLPGMSGYELALAIRRESSLSEIPLVALTGYGQPEDRKRSKAAGFNDHLTKPIQLQVLSRTLSRLLAPAEA